MGTYEKCVAVKKLELDPINKVIKVIYGNASLLDDGTVYFENGINFSKSGDDYDTLFAVNNIGALLTALVNVATNVELGDDDFPIEESLKTEYGSLFKTKEVSNGKESSS